RVGGAGVDLELADLLAAEAGLREHAPDAAAHGLFRLATVQVGERLGLDAAGIAGVRVDDLAVGLVGGEHDLVGVDHDHVVARVDVWGEHRLVLAAQHPRDLGRQTTEDHALGVDDIPGTLDLRGFRGVRGHACHLHRVLAVRTPRDRARGLSRATDKPTGRRHRTANARRDQARFSRGPGDHSPAYEPPRPETPFRRSLPADPDVSGRRFVGAGPRGPV